MSNPIMHSERRPKDELIVYYSSLSDSTIDKISISNPKVGKVYHLGIIADYDDGSTTTPGTVTGITNGQVGTMILESANGATGSTDDAVIGFSGTEFYATGPSTSYTIDTALGGDPGMFVHAEICFASKYQRDIKLKSYVATIQSNFNNANFTRTLDCGVFDLSKDYYVVSIHFNQEASQTISQHNTNNVFPSTLVKYDNDIYRSIESSANGHILSISRRYIPLNESTQNSNQFSTITVQAPPDNGGKNCGAIVMLMEVG